MAIGACIFALLLFGYMWLLSWAKTRRTNILEFKLDDDPEDLAEPSRPKWLWEYPCGLRAGDVLEARRDLELRDSQGDAAGSSPEGELHVVIPGNPDEPNVICLERPDGQRHTWDALNLEAFELTDQRDARF